MSSDGGGERVWVEGSVKKVGPGDVLLTGAFSYGLTAFEGILAVEAPRRAGGGYLAFRLEEHLRRLERSIRALGCPPPATVTQIAGHISDLLGSMSPGSYYVRPFAYRRGLYTDHRAGCDDERMTVAIHATPVAFPAYALAMNRPVKLLVSRSQRLTWPDALARAKISGKYLGPFIAAAEARSQGFDDAILLDAGGCVAEASTANILLVLDGKLVAPPAPPALPGITRATVMHLARELGLQTEERAVMPAELREADEVFLTNTGRGVVGVSAIGGEWLARGQQVTQRLRQAYLRLLWGEQ